MLRCSRLERVNLMCLLTSLKSVSVCMCKHSLMVFHGRNPHRNNLFYVFRVWYVILLHCPKSSLMVRVDRVACSRIYCHSADLLQKYVEMS